MIVGSYAALVFAHVVFTCAAFNQSIAGIEISAVIRDHICKFMLAAR